jgi:hypothetical protein
VFACVLLVACSPPPSPKLPPERDAPDSAKPIAPRGPGKQFPPPPAGFATADFVTTTGGDLDAYAIVDGTLVLTGTTALAKLDPTNALTTHLTLGYGGWADRDHLFLITGEREVAMVTATAITEALIPSVENFKTPKPDSHDELDPGDTVGVIGLHTGLIVTDGEAWWAACPWGIALDGFQCREYVNARLWPTATIETGGTPVIRRSFAWVHAPPPGITMTRTAQSVICDEGGKKLAITPEPGGEEIDHAHWVSASPPRLLVVFGRMGYQSLAIDRWSLHDGCAAKPLATGNQVWPGPGALWIAHDDDGPTERQVLYRGATPLGTLPGDATVYLRPLKR